MIGRLRTMPAGGLNSINLIDAARSRSVALELPRTRPSLPGDEGDWDVGEVARGEVLEPASVDMIGFCDIPGRRFS
jgi:hypothetical protein